MRWLQAYLVLFISGLIVLFTSGLILSRGLSYNNAALDGRLLYMPAATGYIGIGILGISVFGALMAQVGALIAQDRRLAELEREARFVH